MTRCNKDAALIASGMEGRIQMIHTQLIACHGIEYVNRIMDQVYLIIEDAAWLAAMGCRHKHMDEICDRLSGVSWRGTRNEI